MTETKKNSQVLARKSDIPPSKVPEFKCKENLAVIARTDTNRLAQLLEPYRNLSANDPRSMFIMSNLAERLNEHVIPAVPGSQTYRQNVLSVLASMPYDEEVLDLVKLVLSLGAHPEGGSKWKAATRSDSPLEVAVKSWNPLIVKAMLEVGVYIDKQLEPVPIQDTWDYDDGPELETLTLIDRYAYRGKAPLSKLLIEGKHYAVLGRMRSKMLHLEDFFTPYNGLCFIEWAMVCKEFPGYSEMFYRYGIELPTVDMKIPRPPEVVRPNSYRSNDNIVSADFNVLSCMIHDLNYKHDEIGRDLLSCREIMEYVREVAFGGDATPEAPLGLVITDVSNEFSSSDEDYVPVGKKIRVGVVEVEDSESESRPASEHITRSAARTDPHAQAEVDFGVINSAIVDFFESFIAEATKDSDSDEVLSGPSSTSDEGNDLGSPLDEGSVWTRKCYRNFMSIF